MSLTAVQARIAELQALAQQAMNPFAPPSAATAAGGGAGFAGSLAKATMAPPVGTAGAGTASGMRMLAAAR